MLQQEINNLSDCHFRKLTYPRLRLKDFTLDENLPPPPPNFNPPHATSQCDLGRLESLPLELQQHILSQLDLQTLENVRRVCSRALQLVAALPQYKAIRNYARDALRGALGIGTGSYITCERLYETLCMAECEQCGDFGGYIYLITCKRVCFLCFTQDDKYLPLRYTHAINKNGLKRQNLVNLPQMRSLPGRYTPAPMKFPCRTTLVDSEAAAIEGVLLHGSASALKKYAFDLAQSYSGVWPPRHFRCGAELGLPPDRKSLDPFRFVAITRTPWFNRTSKTTEEGAYCHGCKKSYDSEGKHHMHFRRLFTIDTFKEHLKDCGGIEGGRHCRIQDSDE